MDSKLEKTAEVSAAFSALKIKIEL